MSGEVHTEYTELRASDQVALLLVFLVSLVVVHIVLVKLPLAINAALAVCLPRPRSGENGIKRSTSDKSKGLTREEDL